MKISKIELLASMDMHHTYECFYQCSNESIVAVRCANLMDLEDIYSTGIDIVIGEDPKPHITLIPRGSIIMEPYEYIEIPGRYHIYVENSMLSNFCKSIEDSNVSDSLLSILNHRNKNNAERFMQTLKELCLENRLISYKESFYSSIALDWCKVNNIEITE